MTREAAGVLLYGVLFSFITVSRHRTFQTHALDLGQYAQNLWHIARGQEPYDTVLGWHAWGNHFSPIFYVLAPLTLVFHGPAFLLVLQSAALALGAAPLYLFARSRLGPERAAVAAVVYLRPLSSVSVIYTNGEKISPLSVEPGTHIEVVH